MKGIGIAAAAGATATLAVGKALYDMGKAAQESAAVSRTTDAILKSTGASAWTTSSAVSDLANSLSKKTGMDDEAIQSAQNLLLTFKNVKNAGDGQAAMFDRATQAAADLSAAGFGSLDSSAKMLGKALNDPTAGVTALSRAGVTFTKQQKDQIKALQQSGDLLGAQAVVMKEVESQVGGVAEAAASPFDKLNVMLDNFKETVGAAVLPAISKIVDAVGPVLDQLSGPLAAVAGEIGSLVSDVFKQIGPLLPPLVTALVQIVQVLAGGFIQALQALLPAITPVVTIIANLATQIAPILAPILSKIGEVLGALLQAVIPLLGPLADLVMNILTQAGPIIDIVVTVLMDLIKALTPVFNAVSQLIGPLNDLITVVFAAIMPILEPLLPVIQQLADLFGLYMTKAISLLMVQIGFLIQAWGKLAPFILENVTKPVVTFFMDMVSKVLHAAQDMVGWVPWLKGPLNDAVTAFDGMQKGVSDGIQAAADTVATKGSEIGQNLVDMGLKMFNDPNAPQAAGSTFGTNLAIGVQSAAQAAYAAGFNLGGRAADGFRDSIGSTALMNQLGNYFAGASAVAPPIVAPQPQPQGGGGSQTKPKNPFQDYLNSIKDSVAQVKMKAKLIANGVPQALADSIINADGWKTVAHRLLHGGQAALGKFITMWTGSAEGKSAIEAMVSGIVDGAKKQADRLKKALDDFNRIQNDFTRSMMDSASIGSFKPDAGVPITAQGITANLQQRLAALREFQSVMSQLQNPGAGSIPLNKASLMEIYQMGPIDGLAYAKAILAGGQSFIGDLNNLRKQFSTPADILGQNYAELTTGSTQAGLQAAQTFEVQAGAVNITVNGDVSAQTVSAIRQAVTDAMTTVGREARGGRRTGVR